MDYFILLFIAIILVILLMNGQEQENFLHPFYYHPYPYSYYPYRWRRRYPFGRRSWRRYMW